MWPVCAEVEASGEDDLIRSAGAGDRTAFGELYRRYARMVHGILLTRVPVDEAEDLVQDVFVSAMHALCRLRTPAAFRGWLASIARNRAADYHRRTRFGEPLLGERAAHDPHHRALLILDEIRQLPPAYRETLILRLVEGLTGPEIALHTGLKPESVRVNLCRGMQLLRARLRGEPKP